MNISIAKLPEELVFPLLIAIYVKEMRRNMHKDLHTLMVFVMWFMTGKSWSNPYKLGNNSLVK